MLGVPEVVAVDNDPVAVACTRENAARNGVLDRVHSRVGDVSDPAIGAGFDLVLANILAGVLIEQAPAIAGRVAPGAPLVLAGLTLQDVDTVLAAYNRLGFRETERASDEVWSTLQLRRG